MIVLDAGVLIGYLDAADARPERATALLTREVDDDFAITLLTMAEILVAPTRTRVRDRHARLASFDERVVQTARALSIDVADS